MPHASNVWARFNCLHARATECLSKLHRSSQCTVMPIKLLLLTVQQSDVVAMYAILLIAFFTCSFIVIVVESILCRTVDQDMTTHFGCKSRTRLWNDGCLTREKGWSPWTIKWSTVLSTDFWEICLVSSSFICLTFEEYVPASDFLLQTVVVSSQCFFSWHPCFLYKRVYNFSLKRPQINSDWH